MSLWRGTVVLGPSMVLNSFGMASTMTTVMGSHHGLGLFNRIEPERDLATSPVLHSIELGHRFSWWSHTISLRVGAVRSKSATETSTRGTADAQWEWRF